jgi:pimeloyl-ACP methyl ester carboxylesterase
MCAQEHQAQPHMRTHITVVLFAAALCACAVAPPPPSPYKKPRLELLPCQVRDVEEPLLCGTLEVPEDQARPYKRTLLLNVVVVPAVSLVTLPPLYSLEGGPGLPASGSVGFWAAEGMIHRRSRDIVLVDQRGTGGSGALPCAINFSSPLEPVLSPDAARACRYRLSPKAELARYTTADAVADLEAVREALGHELIDLAGLSYGTRLAQEYLRKHPTRVRAMALLGTLAPHEKLPLSFSANAHDVLMRLARQCEADAGCRRIAPKAGADLAALRARFKAGPVRAVLADGRAVMLEAGPFWEAVRAQLASTASQRRLPWLLHEAARGRFAPLLEAAAPAGDDGAANGLLLSVTCAEDTRHITEDELAPLRDSVFGDYRARQQIAACREWPGSAVPRDRSVVTSDVPALLMAGDMDHVTPVQWARDVASGLVNARVVVVPHLGHLPDGLSHMECYDRLIYDFFEAGSAANLDLSCIGTMQPPAFVQ